jgi:hypothetical protein
MKNVRNVFRWLAVLQCFLFAIITISSAEEVCFRHKIRDTIKNDCMKIQKAGENSLTFKCFDDISGSHKAFVPGNDWEMFDGNSPICKPSKNSDADPFKGGGEKNKKPEDKEKK